MTTNQQSSAQLLMSPISGIPLSLKLLEEHSSKRQDGTFAAEYTITAQQYRDSAGRVRIESETKDRAGHSSGSTVSITDPVAGLQTFLVTAEKIAYQRHIKFSGPAQLIFTDAADGQDTPHEWKVTKEEAGEQTIEGYEFKGSRIVTSAEDSAGLTTTLTQWYSENLKLVGAVDRLGPVRTYAIRVEQLQRGEPDTSLFEVPSDYKVVDIGRAE